MMGSPLLSKVPTTRIDLPQTICCASTVPEYGPSTSGDRVADVHDRMPQVLGRDTERAVATLAELAGSKGERS